MITEPETFPTDWKWIIDFKYRSARQFWSSFHPDFYASVCRVLKKCERAWSLKDAEAAFDRCMFLYTYFTENVYNMLHIIRFDG